MSLSLRGLTIASWFIWQANLFIPSSELSLLLLCSYYDIKYFISFKLVLYMCISPVDNKILVD